MCKRVTIGKNYKHNTCQKTPQKPQSNESQCKLICPYCMSRGPTTHLSFSLSPKVTAWPQKYILFVDLVKAFDTVNNCSLLLLILAKYGIPINMIWVIKSYTWIASYNWNSEEKYVRNGCSIARQEHDPNTISQHHASSHWISSNHTYL